MPSLSPTMNAGNILGWRKAVGDEVAVGAAAGEAAYAYAAYTDVPNSQIRKVRFSLHARMRLSCCPPAKAGHGRAQRCSRLGAEASPPTHRPPPLPGPQVTARRLLESKQQVPHYYLTISARVDRLQQLR